MEDTAQSRTELLAEIQSLRERLATSEETLQAIQQGEVDALIVSTAQGDRVFTLQSADRSYRLLVEAMQQGAAILSPEGLILYCNRSFAALLKQSLETLIGSQFEQFIAPSDLPTVQTLLQQAAQGERNALELFLTTHEAALPVYLSIHYVNLGDLSIHCIVVTDLSEQKRHEATIAAERLARLILEQAGEAILVCDHEGYIIRASEVASQLWGEPILGRGFDTLAPLHWSTSDTTLFDSDPGSIARPKPETDRDQASFQLAAVLQGESYRGLAVELKRRDGQVLSLVLNARPLNDWANHFRGAVVILTDVTERKKAEVALQLSQLHLQRQLAEIETIYQSAPIGLNVLDTDLRFIKINQRLADMNGLSIEAHLGRTVRELLPELADATEQLLRRILETGEPLLNVEITGETPAQPGIQRTWLEHFLPLKSGDRVIGINTVCEEITERKRLEADRNRAEAALRKAKEELEIRVAERTAELRQKNTELQQSESTLRSFFNSGGMMMAIVEMHDNDIRYISANRATAEFLGTTPEALENQFVSDLGRSQQTIQQVLEYYRKAQSLQAPVRLEYCYDQGGEPRWLSVSLCPIAVSSSGYPRFSFIAKDVTDRKRAEATLADREEQLRLTLEFTHIGTWDWHLPTNHVIWNDNHFRLMGLEPTSTALYQLWRNVIHPDDVERVEQALLKALTDHTNYETEYRVVYPDGTLHWLVGKGRGIYDDVGTPIRMLGVILDVTDRKQAEKRLELQAVITRNMAEGICLVRADNGVIVYANPKFEQMFGYDSGELQGCHVSIVNYATDANGAEAVNQAIRSAVLQKGESTYEVHNVKKDGTPFWCSATTSVFQHPDYGDVLVAVQQDITDRKRAEERIAASLKEKEVLLKEIHHRVKNNLGIVSSLLQMQARRTQVPQARAILQDSQNRIGSIALVHEKLYRSEDLASVDFSQYLQDLTSYLFDSYNTSTNQVTLDIEVEPVSLEIETAIPCGLIVNELVSNALKHAFPDQRTGTIQVSLAPAVDPASTEEAQRLFTLSVRDTGIGLADDFDLARANTLGLSLVYGLVAQIRGTIEINSTQGTEFKITFTGNSV